MTKTYPIGSGRGCAPDRLYPLSLLLGGAALTVHIPLSVAIAFGLGLIGIDGLLRWLNSPRPPIEPGAKEVQPSTELDLLDAEIWPG